MLLLFKSPLHGVYIANSIQISQGLTLVSRSTELGSVTPKFRGPTRATSEDLFMSHPRSSMSSLLLLPLIHKAYPLLLLDLSLPPLPCTATQFPPPTLPSEPRCLGSSRTYCVETSSGQGQQTGCGTRAPRAHGSGVCGLPPGRGEAGFAPYLTQLSRNLLCWGWFK